MYLNIAKKLAPYFKISTEIIKIEMGALISNENRLIGKHKKKKARFYPRLFWIMKINGFFTSYESPFSYSTESRLGNTMVFVPFFQF